MSNDYMADLCDKLLGVDRNDPLTMKITKGVQFFEPDVCKPFLVGFCPHLTFSNTKSDVGPCPRRVHEESLREEFEQKGGSYRCDYEIEFFGILHRMIQDLQRKIRKAQSRLEAKPTGGVEQLLNPEKDEYEERRAIIDVQIKTLIRKMEEFVEQGKMKEVQEINSQLEILRAEIMRIKMAEESNPLVKQDKKMEVCQVCGSLLIMNDVQKRLEAHFEGKQHAGFVKVWEYFELYKKKYPDVYSRLEGHGGRRGFPSGGRERALPRRDDYPPRRRSPPPSTAREHFDRHRSPVRQFGRHRSPSRNDRHSDRSIHNSGDGSRNTGYRSHREETSRSDRPLHGEYRTQNFHHSDENERRDRSYNSHRSH